MSLPNHPLLSLVDEHATGLKSLLTHYIDATVDSQFASLRNSIETMIQSGVIGPNCDGTHFGMTLPPQTQTNTDQSSDESSHEYSNEQLAREQNDNLNLQNEVSLSNKINTGPMIKQEFDDEEDGEDIDDVNVAKCENSEKGICTPEDNAEMGENGDESYDTIQHNFHALENNQTNQLIISNDNSPSPTNTEPLIKQECLNDSSITSIPLDFPNNAAPNDIFTDEQTEGQNTQIETNEFDDDDYGEGEYLNNPNCEDCANGDCDLDHENNNNLLNNEVSAGDEDVDEDGHENEHSNLQSISSSTTNQMTNIETDQIARAVIIEPNNQQSTQSTSGVRFSTRKRISKKVFRSDDQSNDDAKRHKSATGKRVQSNKSVKKAKHTIDTRATLEHYDLSQHNSDEPMVIQQEKMNANNAIGEEIAKESTTNLIQPNHSQPNRHLKCPHCHKSFDRNSNLQRHVRVHTGERPFQCDKCDKRFKDRGTLAKHQLIHQNIKRFQCDYCDKKFTLKCNLDVHEQSIHLHVKPYRCKQCGHTATHQSHLIKHIRMFHFNLPQTIKEQQTLNIIDHRDPRELLEKV